MAAKKLTVVISQSQGKNPRKRQLEEEIAAALIMDPNVDVSLVPHLYDMNAEHTGLLHLRSMPGDLVVLAWLYPRAIRWTLNRQKVQGQEGVSLLVEDDDDDDDDDHNEKESDENGDGSSDAVGAGSVPQRKIYCIDFSVASEPELFLEEIRRIGNEKNVETVDLMSWIGGSPEPQQLERYLQSDDSRMSNNGAGVNGVANTTGESVKRRWYPVIDYSRCTNCMECIDFCLFGVYGVDQQELILVEEQDSCKKGCPACSRVCPENAILFPGHKTPAIAGADGVIGNLKIDLSQLFGAPTGVNAIDAAVAERDAELVADGREAVGMSIGVPKRQADSAGEPRDELDALMDDLDAMEM